LGELPGKVVDVITKQEGEIFLLEKIKTKTTLIVIIIVGDCSGKV